MAEEITALWQEAEQQLQHGAWLPACKDRGIAYTTANRLIRLRQQYPEINQFGEFGSVSAALTRGRPVPICFKEHPQRGNIADPICTVAEIEPVDDAAVFEGHPLL